MTTNISAQNDRILEEAVRNGQFKDKQEALSEALRMLAEKTSDPNGVHLPAGAWRERFQKHLEATPHTSATTVDDSRESIYQGRGE